MESDSHGDVSSGSDYESQKLGPRSPDSSGGASLRGPRSPSDDEDSRDKGSSPRSSRSKSKSPSRSLSASPNQNNAWRYKNSEISINSSRRGPVSPPAVDGNSSDSSDSSRDSRKSIASRESRSSRKSNESRESRKSLSSQKSVEFRRSRKSAESIESGKSDESEATRKSLESSNSKKSAGSRKSFESMGSRISMHSRSSRNSNTSNRKIDAQAEEISDGDMEYERDKDSEEETRRKKPINDNEKLNLSHEDLSDVSDVDSLGENTEEELLKEPENLENTTTIDLRQKIDNNKNKKLQEAAAMNENQNKTEDAEEQLDFEAEDGECVDESQKQTEKTNQDDKQNKDEDEDEDGAIEEKAIDDKDKKEKDEEIEEGEVTDDDEVRPEETEPRPVCRFYSRGQCTWGASCRFLHPGVTDKGNYTMFELIRPMIPGNGSGAPYGAVPDDRYGLYGGPPMQASMQRGLHGEGPPPPVESAWERGLRTAKEMVRKSLKRKEQDVDFDEKKMNLTLAQEELDKENGYYARATSPIGTTLSDRPSYSSRHLIPPSHEYRQSRVPEEYYSRRVLYETETRLMRVDSEYDLVPRERVRSYRELPTHRMPDYYNDKYEEPAIVSSSRRSKREVIVQRVEAPASRGDEWADPWMRSKSPSSKGKSSRLTTTPRRQSFSTASSYSSSSSSGSSKSSYRSRSRSQSPPASNRGHRSVKSPSHRNKQVSTISSSSISITSHHHHRSVVSPSVIISEKKAANERAQLMNPPAPNPRKGKEPRRPPSPGMMRTVAQNPPAPVKVGNLKQDAERKKMAMVKAIAGCVKSRTRASRSTSESDSSGSSSSDSESSYSSSSSNSDGSPSVSGRRKVADKSDLAAAIKALDVKRQIKLNLSKQQMKKPSLTEIPDLSRKPEKIELLQGKKRPAASPPSVASLELQNKLANVNKKSTSRREELLKQLKAVEDAIAKKRSKTN